MVILLLLSAGSIHHAQEVLREFMGLPHWGEAGSREGRETKLQSRWRRGLHRSQPSLLPDLWQGDQGHISPNLPTAHWAKGKVPSLSLCHSRQSQAEEEAAGRLSGGWVQVSRWRPPEKHPHHTCWEVRSPASWRKAGFTQKNGQSTTAATAKGSRQAWIGPFGGPLLHVDTCVPLTDL